MMRLSLLLLTLVGYSIQKIVAFSASRIQIPPVSPATNLPNLIYNWHHRPRRHRRLLQKEEKGEEENTAAAAAAASSNSEYSSQQIRYQVNGPTDGKPIVLIHGLFVNSDHWRFTLKELGDAGYRTYAIDLWGCGYSSKPKYDSNEAQAFNGENRFANDNVNDVDETNPKTTTTLPNVQLGTSCGTKTRTVDVDLCHPIKSPYNFFTWSELITDFCNDVVLDKNNSSDNINNNKKKVTIVCNSIGTISSLQAVIDDDTPGDNIFDGVFVVSPNFRELHSAEIPVPQLSMPIIRSVQKLLRENGQGLFDSLAKPDIVKQILKEPYANVDAVDDVLVQVLLDPLLTDGASNVVFDTLSYSAGPLPEQQLSMFPPNVPVWVCYGKSDPWTPPGRVEALTNKDPVEKVVGWDNVGHCPHDEAPQLVHPLLFDFLKRLEEGTEEK